MPINLEPIASGYNLSLINDNFQTIENSWDEKLDRLTSEHSNQLEQDVDMNSNRIINHPNARVDDPLNTRDIVLVEDLHKLGDNTGVIPAYNNYTGNGTQTTFALPAAINDARALQVYIEGIRQEPLTDYTLDAGAVVFTTAPVLGVSIDLYAYNPVLLENGVPVYAEPITGSFTGDGTNTSFVVPAPSATTKATFVSINGINQEPTKDFTAVNGNVSFSEAPPAGSEIFVRVFAPYVPSEDIGGTNLLPNHNFTTPALSHTLPAPDATARSYPPGYELFSGVFANETTGVTNLTYTDGRVNCTAGDYYFKVSNTGALARVPAFTASIADYDGKPRLTGVSFALNTAGDEYIITVDSTATDVFSVKFEQGERATEHEVGPFLEPLSGYLKKYDNGVTLGGEEGGPSHFSATGDAGSGFWAIPGSYDKSAQPQTASFKAFHDNYAEEFTKPSAVRSYRVGIFTSDVDDSSVMGVGSSRLDGKGGGEYYGTNPELLITQRDGDFHHLRAMTTPVRAPHPTMQNLGYYKFDDVDTVWKGGVAVELGQLMLSYGRVIEAQSAGVTGQSRPRHGAYRHTKLTVTNIGSTVAGDYLRVPSPLKQANVLRVDGNDIYLRNENPFDTITTGDTVEIFTGGALHTTTTVNADALVVTDYTGTGDFDPTYENTMSWTGDPVDGLMQSDGNIVWKFIDDIKDFVPTNGKLRQILMLGDTKEALPLMFSDYSVQLVSDTLVLDGKKLSFYFDTNKDFMDIQRSSTGTLEITHSAHSGKVIISPQSRYWATPEMVYQQPATTINDTGVPNVAGASLLTVNNSSGSPLNITGFTGAVPNTELTVRAGNANCVLKQGAGLELGGSDIAMYPGQVVKFAFFGGTKYYKIS